MRDDMRADIYVVLILYWVMTYVVVGLRVYVRTGVTRSFGRDDVAMLLALGLFTAYLCCQAISLAHGIGQHRDKIPDEDLPIGFAAWLFAEVFYICATSATKIAVGLFLNRITQVKWHIWVIRALMAATAVVGSAYLFVVLLQCHPLSFYWDFSPDAKGSCITPNVLVTISYVVSGLNCLADWCFGILPIFIVKDLNMKRNTKIVVAGILVFASIGSLATLIRMFYVKQLGVYKGDFLYSSSYVSIWSTVEVGVGISAASLATLRPLLHKFFPNLLVDKAAPTAEPGAQWSAKVRRNLEGFSLRSVKSHLNATLTTTVTGANGDQWGMTGSQENIMGERNNDTESPEHKIQGGGISKSIQVTTIEERNISRSLNGRKWSEASSDLTLDYNGYHA